MGNTRTNSALWQRQAEDITVIAGVIVDGELQCCGKKGSDDLDEDVQLAFRPVHQKCEQHG